MRPVRFVVALIAVFSLSSCLTFNWQRSVLQAISNACNTKGDCGSDGPGGN
ncbi:hypothetical protein LPB41_30295 [Thalassospira sp. MA62]|nr:hypothetical protein [Thalassospira sp. MA62]